MDGIIIRITFTSEPIVASWAPWHFFDPLGEPGSFNVTTVSFGFQLPSEMVYDIAGGQHLHWVELGVFLFWPYKRHRSLVIGGPIFVIRTDPL